ncbi:MAG: CRTAC1 family protein [Pyrinomonadaceae bacterium]|nr:CRTAC1 family protein [Phycisphaerales bacterium]
MHLLTRALCFGVAITFPALAHVAASRLEPPIRFIDATDELGIGAINSTRLCFADVNSDGRTDVVIRTSDAYRIFLHTLDAASKHGFKYVELLDPSGLPKPRDGDCMVFADIDNDATTDAILTRYLDINNEKFKAPEDQPTQTAWIKGNGDGTFTETYPITTKQATTACIAVGDVDRDGRLDLYLGNWYTRYGVNNEAFTNDLLIQSHERTRAGFFVRAKLPEDDATFDEEQDQAGRPTYGAVVANFGDLGGGDTALPMPQVLELSYGRRANRLWHKFFTAGVGAAGIMWEDAAPRLGLDGDANRSGKYPDWLKEVARTDARFDRPDEKPYRSHGNNFDAAIGDVNNDGLFDVFLAGITHAWAGDSSDRSRFLIQTRAEGETKFEYQPNRNVDRVPPPPNPLPDGYRPKWNQGDLFCELADLDHDGRLDLVLSSGDYPDPAPYDNRLRIFHQQPDGSFRDITGESGIDHVGSGQISLADVDVDGDMDILVAQSYNRLPPDIIRATNERQKSEGARMRLFLNQASQVRPGSALTLSFLGNPRLNVALNPLGVIAKLTLTQPDGAQLTQMRQLIGIGGHAGKQNQFLIHFGLADAKTIDKLEIIWPCSPPLVTTVVDVEVLKAGHHVMRATKE